MVVIFVAWLKGMMDKEPPEPDNPIGTVVIGTLDPDLMTTAKEMVRKALKRAQFKTVDIGRGAAPEAFAKKAKETNADIIVISVLLTAAKKNLPKVVSAMEVEGIKDKVTLMIGGDAVDDDDAKEIGAMYGESKEEAVIMAKKVMEEKKK
jgi:5-methyltetrahydrofolate--homocysteine methyltransferase